LLYEKRLIDGINEEVLIEACGRRSLSRFQMLRFDYDLKFKKASASNINWTPERNFTAGLT